MTTLQELMKKTANDLSVNMERPCEKQAQTEENRQYLACLRECAGFNESSGDLNKSDGYNCKICANKGFTFHVVSHNGYYSTVARPCKCMNTRKTLRKLAASGLGGIIRKYTFDRYKASEPWQSVILDKAFQFIGDCPNWFFIGGQSGSGKTHICTAICAKMLKRHKNVSYMLWVNDVKQLKGTVMDSAAHKELITGYKNADVLYIDDFFKQGKDKFGGAAQPSPAEINLAYDILNHRYLDSRYITIISSERTFSEIEEIDEAIAGRIYECCGDGEYILNVNRGKDHNYRLKKMTNV